MKLVWRKLKMIPHIVLPVREFQYVICFHFLYSFMFLYMYIHNSVHIIFKIWYITIILSYFLLCAFHFMQGFLYEERCRINWITLRPEVSSQEMKKTCISTFKRTQHNISQRWSHIRLYGPLHEYLLPGVPPSPVWLEREGGRVPFPTRGHTYFMS